ncbi:hypothetical protein [Paenibacillus hubeiensis]|uniref:hypothetical protein n=1 Tax=Paenibacillus hubeiensis TaxID=3077330 RepID=UPI0031B9B175
MKKKIISSLMVLAMAVPFSSAFASSGVNNWEDVLKETSTGQYVAAKEDVSFQEALAAIKEIQAQNHAERLEKDQERLAELGLEGAEPIQSGEIQRPGASDGGITIMSGEIQGGSKTYINEYGFQGIIIQASTNWSNYATYSSWDYSTVGWARPGFSSAKVSTTMGLYGLTTSWPPTYKEYTHESNWVYNNTIASISGSDWGAGVFAYASAASSMTAAPQGSGNYHTFDY